MDKKMKLTKLERQLKLYEILLPCAIAEFTAVCQVYRSEGVV